MSNTFAARPSCLQCNNFTGTLPPLAFPSTMRELNLTNNTLSGTIGDLSATSLQVIDFSNNTLAGPLPMGAQLPSSLKLLKLQDNRLTGAALACVPVPPFLRAFSP